MNQKSINLYLDIDGVLHPAYNELASPKNGGFSAVEDIRIGLIRGTISPQSFGLLCVERQGRLVNILAKNPHVNVVISSAWRNWIGYNPWENQKPDLPWETSHVETLEWLKQLLHPTIASRIIGKTENGKNRLSEIRDFELQWSRDQTSWIAIDDAVKGFPPTAITPYFSEVPSLSAPMIQFKASKEMLILLDGEQGLSKIAANAIEKAIISIP
jgi:hypothetical protein